LPDAFAELVTTAQLRPAATSARYFRYATLGVLVLHVPLPHVPNSGKDNIVDAMQLDEHCAVVALTQDPKAR